MYVIRVSDATILAFVDFYQSTEVLTDYLQDLICAIRDPKQVWVLVGVVLGLQHSGRPGRLSNED
jgi:hypothetical protein